MAVNQQHRFGTDAFLLASFAAPRHKDMVCDLCTGCGIVALLQISHYNCLGCTGVEIVPEAAQLFEAGIEKSNLQGRVKCLRGDLKQVCDQLPEGSFDVVTCNPPYKKLGSGIMSQSSADQLARHETACTIEDICKVAKRLLKFGGRLCICQRPERMVDCLVAMRNNGIEPKRIQMVAKRPHCEPWLVLIEGKRGAKPHMRVEPLFVIQDETGGMSPQLQRAYGQGE